jgi:hypothetical protein
MEPMSAWKEKNTNGVVTRRSEKSNSSKVTHCWGILIYISKTAYNTETALHNTDNVNQSLHTLIQITRDPDILTSSHMARD